MKRIFDFLSAHIYAIVWTACYVFIMWVILRYMFNFEIFRTSNWIRLAHAHIRGFGGFVFGILILAAVPLYIATTTIVIRNNCPLFKIPFPGFIKRAFTPTFDPCAPETAPAPAPDNTDATPEKSDTPAEKPLPANMPPELRPAFQRIREKVGPLQTSAFNAPATPQNTPVVPIAEKVPVGELTPPMDFDFLDSDFDIDDTPTDAPIFKEIDFGMDDTPVEIPQDIQNIPAPEITDDAPDANAPLAKFLGEHKIAVREIDNGVIITDRDAIIVHDDPAFWVADETDWFAPKKQKPSPIVTVQEIAATHGVRPVIYLAETNIMDLENLREKWLADGITVISDPNDLINE